MIPLVVPYEVGGRRERLVYLSREGDLAAYEELRAGFTAAVSHELRTPLARLLTLLETTTLPGEDVPALVEQARGEIDQITELIDEVLFLSELESGARVVALGADARAVRCSRRRSTSSASARLAPESRSRLECDDDVELAIRPRMLRVVARNLAENAIRYAGPGRDVHALRRARRRRRRSLRARRRDRRRRGRAAAALRALLSRGPRARVARNRARPRDREAHRHAGGRHRRGARGPRARPRGPLRASRRP